MGGGSRRMNRAERSTNAPTFSDCSCENQEVWSVNRVVLPEPTVRIFRDEFTNRAILPGAAFRTNGRSNSNCAMDGKTLKIRRPAGVVVSISSARERKPKPRLLMASTLSSRSSRERGEAVILGDNDHVAAAELVKQPVQLWPLPGCAADRIGKHPLSTGTRQSSDLRISGLVAGGDSSVTYDRATSCQLPPKTVKFVEWGFWVIQPFES